MKIMVGYNNSKVAKEAFQLAKEHAKAFGAKVFVVTSLTQSGVLKLEDIQKVEIELENLKILFKEDGIECETHAVVSALSTGENLVQFAKENEFDEILIGVRKRSKTGKLLFGSNAQHVILEAECPVVAGK